jgi:hypothetical protein
MDITMIGLQNAGKTSLLRVLAVSPRPVLDSFACCPDAPAPRPMTDCVQGGEFTVEYVHLCLV